MVRTDEPAVPSSVNNVFAVVPLAGTQLAAELDEASDLAELASMALAATQHGASIIEQLAAFAGRQRLEPTQVEVRSLLDSVAGMCRRAYGRLFSFEVTCPSDVGSVWADEPRLGSVLFNVCLNAVDALPDGGRVVLRASATSVSDGVTRDSDELPPGDFVVIEVVDDGVGMSPDTLARAVEPMFTTKNRASHPGLGLSAAHGVVQHSHGHLSIMSEEGGGTTVAIWLPRSDVTGSTPRRSDDEHAGDDAE